MIVPGKLQNLDYSRYLRFQEKLRKKRKELLLFVEHPACITAGTTFQKNNLLFSESLLTRKKIGFYQIKRGGDVTAHEPGQLVIYPHVDLKKRNIGIAGFLDTFLEAIRKSVLEVWKIELCLKPESPGLYLKKNPEKKLVSIGVQFKQFFTSFGAAINISNSLETFSCINPCGGKASDIVSIQSLNQNPGKEEEFREIFLKLFLYSLG